MRNRKTVQLTTDAMLAAMCAVLGAAARFTDFGFIKISFESLPVLVAALLFGPIDGAAVGLIGTLLSQLLLYGPDASTPLWIYPYVIAGIVCGLYARKYRYYNTPGQIRFIVSVSEVLIFLMNTVSLYFYAQLVTVFHTEWTGAESGMAYVLSGLPGRLIVLVLKAVGFAFLMPPLLTALHKFRNRTVNEERN